MGVDNSNDFGNAKSKINALKEFNNVNQSIKNATTNVNQFQSKVSDIQQSLDSAKIEEAIKNKVSSSFEQLIQLISMTKGTSLSTSEFLRGKFIKVVKKIQPVIMEILTQEMISALGCSNESTYQGNLDLYIKVSSIDLFKSLIIDPTTSSGKAYYEIKNVSNETLTQTKRPTNKMLYNLTQNEGQTLSALYGTTYNGVSNQSLFDISFVTFNPVTGQSGKYYKVTLSQKLDGIQRVTDFLMDYLKTIDLIDLKGFITKLIDLVLNIFSVDVGFGSATIDDSSKFGLIIQRILGMCFDFDEEINVGGSVKTPEIDNVDTTFFQFGEIDLRKIDQKISNIQLGIVEFEDCNNVKLPITNTGYVLDSINEITEDGENANSTVDNIVNSLTNDPRWSLAFPFPNDLKLSINNDFIKNFPLAVVGSLLTPKIILPFIVMYKALGRTFDDTVQGFMGFVKEFKKLIINIASRIGAIFVEVLFEDIKKDILRLTRQILQDIKNEAKSTEATVILALLDTAILVVNTINDFRKCKSLLELLLQLFNLKIPRVGSITPPSLLPFSAALPGTSPKRQLLNTIEGMQKLGLPTGPNKDGSPNLGLQAMFSQLAGQKKDQDQNGKVEIHVPALAVAALGGGSTIPSTASGKFF